MLDQKDSEGWHQFHVNREFDKKQINQGDECITVFINCITYITLYNPSGGLAAAQECLSSRSFGISGGAGRLSPFDLQVEFSMQETI